jgi:hypothetical protein
VLEAVNKAMNEDMENSWLVQEVLAAPPAKGFTKLWKSRASAYVSLWNYELKAFGFFISP